MDSTYIFDRHSSFVIVISSVISLFNLKENRVCYTTSENGWNKQIMLTYVECVFPFAMNHICRQGPRKPVSAGGQGRDDLL